MVLNNKLTPPPNTARDDDSIDDPQEESSSQQANNSLTASSSRLESFPSPPAVEESDSEGRNSTRTLLDSDSELDSIEYIPPVSSEMALGQSDGAMHTGPVWLFLEDVKVLLSVSRGLHRVIMPFSMQVKGGELYGERSNICAKLALGVVSMGQLLLLPLFVLVFVLFFAYIGLSRMVTRSMLHFSQGVRIVKSNPECTGASNVEDLNTQLKRERWVFFNGIMSGYALSFLATYLYCKF